MGPFLISLCYFFKMQVFIIVAQHYQCLESGWFRGWKVSSLARSTFSAFTTTDKGLKFQQNLLAVSSSPACHNSGNSSN